MDSTLAEMLFAEEDSEMVAKGVGDAAERGQARTVTVEGALGVAAVAMAAKRNTNGDKNFIVARIVFGCRGAWTGRRC
jgi:hypothetical protein